MPDTTPLVSAIILNFCDGLHAVECVRVLRQQTIADSIEILVVDNHSEDDSIGILRNRLHDTAGVRILESARNDGFGAGYMIGIAHAKGTYLLINNPVKKLAPDSLKRMVDVLQADPTIGIVAPKLVHDDGTVRLSARSFPSPLDVVIKRTFLSPWFRRRMAHYLQLDLSPDQRRDTDWVIGGCFLIRADFLRSLGGFDPRFFLFFEDIDLCKRCWQAGKRVVYLPEAIAKDRKQRLSEGGLLTLLTTKTGRAHIVSAVRYFQKWGW